MQGENEYYEDEQSRFRAERTGGIHRSRANGSQAKRRSDTKKAPAGPGGVRQRRNKRWNW